MGCPRAVSKIAKQFCVNQHQDFVQKMFERRSVIAPSLSQLLTKLEPTLNRINPPRGSARLTADKARKNFFFF
jgi:hypothetical protein